MRSAEPLRILLVVHGFPPSSLGGTETYTYELAQGLIRRGHPVHVFYRQNLPLRPRYTVESGTYRGIAYTAVNAPETPPRSFPDTYVDRGIELSFLEAVRFFKPDVIHFTYVLGGLSATLLGLAKGAGVPVVVTLTDFAFMCPRAQLAGPGLRPCEGPSDGGKCAACITAPPDAGRPSNDAEAAAPPPQGIVRPDPTGSAIKQLIRLLPAPADANESIVRALVQVHTFFNRRIKNPLLWSVAYARMVLHDFAVSAPHRLRSPQMRPFRIQPADTRRRDSYLRRTLLQSDLVITATTYLRDKFLEWGVPPEKMLYSPFGVDETLFEGCQRLPSNRLRLGYVGQIAAHKGLHVLLEAIRDFPPDRVELKVYGLVDRPAARTYYDSIQGIADGGKVSFLGSFQHHEVGAVMGGIDVLVVPSLWAENCPSVVREAIMARVPMVVSDGPGLAPYVREGVTGYVCPMGDVDSLKKALHRFVDDPALAAYMSRNITPFKTISEQAAEFEETYRRLANSMLLSRPASGL